MKKRLLYLLSCTFILLLLFRISNAQTCPLAKDSIISGDMASAYQIYSYDTQNRLVKLIMVDSAGTLTSSNYDTLTYDGNDNVVLVERIDGISGSNMGTTALTYNGNNQVTQIVVSGDNGSPWSMTHDITYSGNDIVSIILTNTTGTPDGFPGSFTNMVYSGGNLTTLNLEMDFGMGMDTLEMTATYDAKNNLNAMLYIREAPDLIGFNNSNNILQITFDNNEIIGPAGSIAIQSTYTYNVDNDVETRTVLPGVFDSSSFTQQFYYDCNALSVEEYSQVAVELFPNPFTSSIQVDLEELGNQPFDLVLVNILGVEVYRERYSNVSTVNLDGLDDLNSGLYFLQIKYGDHTITQKLLKE